MRTADLSPSSLDSERSSRATSPYHASGSEDGDLFRERDIEDASRVIQQPPSRFISGRVTRTLFSRHLRTSVAGRRTSDRLQGAEIRIGAPANLEHADDDEDGDVYDPCSGPELAINGVGNYLRGNTNGASVRRANVNPDNEADERRTGASYIDVDHVTLRNSLIVDFKQIHGHWTAKRAADTMSDGTALKVEEEASRAIKKRRLARATENDSIASGGIVPSSIDGQNGRSQPDNSKSTPGNMTVGVGSTTRPDAIL